MSNIVRSTLNNLGQTDQVKKYISTGSVSYGSKSFNDVDNKLMSKYSEASYTTRRKVTPSITFSDFWNRDVKYSLSDAADSFNSIIKNIYLEFTVEKVQAEHPSNVGYIPAVNFMKQIKINLNGEEVDSIDPDRQAMLFQHILPLHKDDYLVLSHQRGFLADTQSRCLYNGSRDDEYKFYVPLKCLLTNIKFPMLSLKKTLFLDIKMKDWREVVCSINNENISNQPKLKDCTLWLELDLFNDQQLAQVKSSTIPTVIKSYRSCEVQHRQISINASQNSYICNLNEELNMFSSAFILFFITSASDSSWSSASNHTYLHDQEKWHELINYYVENDQQVKIRWLEALTPEFIKEQVGYENILKHSRSEFLLRDGAGLVDGIYSTKKLGVINFCDNMSSAVEGYNSGSYHFMLNKRVQLFINFLSTSNAATLHLFSFGYKIDEYNPQLNKVTTYKN